MSDPGRKPSDVQDDGEFRYAVLSPKAASESGKPGTDAKRFIDETTAPVRRRAQRVRAEGGVRGHRRHPEMRAGGGRSRHR